MEDTKSRAINNEKLVQQQPLKKPDSELGASCPSLSLNHNERFFCPCCFDCFFSVLSSTKDPPLEPRLPNKRYLFSIPPETQELVIQFWMKALFFFVSYPRSCHTKHSTSQSSSSSTSILPKLSNHLGHSEMSTNVLYTYIVSLFYYAWLFNLRWFSSSYLCVSI